MDKCEEFRSIDLAWLRREGMLDVGKAGSLRWSRDGEVIFSVLYRVDAEGFRLIYRTRRYDGDWRDVDEVIPFTWSRTNFDGRRQWFVCLACRRRCRVLYGGSLFRCRKCYDLKYESQYEAAFSRGCSQRHKLRKALGQSGSLEEPLAPRPKGMHWATYNRIVAKDRELEQRWLLGAARWLGVD